MAQIESGDLEAAGASLREAIALVRQQASVLATRSILETAASLACRSGDAHAAARLFGAAHDLAQESGLAHDPADERFLSRALAQTRQTLGENAFRAAHHAGAILEVDAALEEALRSVQLELALSSHPR
jgi:hypothetical protein